MSQKPDAELARSTAAVIARAMNDAEFRARLVADPVAVLSAEGFEIPEGMTVQVLESTPEHGYMVLPDPDSLGDELLAAASGAGTASSAGSASTAGCVPFTLSTASCVGSAGSAG